MNAPSRFQFSLRTLLILTISVGALIGLFITRVENAKLHEENHAMREELGYLDIKDPKTGWVRAVPVTDTNHFRFRVYVPRAGKYQIGIQTQEIERDKINRESAYYLALALGGMKECFVDLRLIMDADGRGTYTVTLSENDLPQTNTRATTSLIWQKAGFDSKHYGNVNLFLKSTAFDPTIPLTLLTIKVDKIVPGAGPTRSTTRTTKPGPGLMLWFEEEPPKP